MHAPQRHPQPLARLAQGKTAAAAAAAAPVERSPSVDDLMLKLAALGSAALGADPESAAAALANSAAASLANRDKQPRRMKLLRSQVMALQEKQQALEEEMNRKEEVGAARGGWA